VLPDRTDAPADPAVGVVGHQVDPLINQAVAVVIDVVAHLGGGCADIDRDLIGAVAIQAILTGAADIAADAAVVRIDGEVEPFVDRQVAVVVDVVAYLGRRYATGLWSGPRAVTVGADLPACTNVSAESAVERIIGQYEAIVNDAVAVIVNVVAYLGGRHATILRHGPLAVAVVAHLPGRADMAADTAVGRVGEEVDPLVDEAVAVVVDVVAHLGGRNAIVGWHVPGTGTVLTVLAACTSPSAHAAVGIVDEQVEAVIDDAVAVIVNAVADFGTGGAVDRGSDPLAVAVVTHLSGSANQTAGAAVELVAQQVEALVDGAVAVVVGVVANLRTGTAVEHRSDQLAVAIVADRARTAITTAHAAVGVVGEEVESLVDEAVAVVVAIVADFGSRHAVVHRHGELAYRVLADGAGIAHAAACAAVERIAEEVEPLIDVPVAIVVDVVAELGSRRDAIVRRNGVGAVSVGTELAGAAAMPAGAAVGSVCEQVEAVVDHAIAVVIDVVAGLGGRRAGILRVVPLAVPVIAGLVGRASVAADPAVGRVGQQVECLVDRGVAIVVDVVADFRARRAAVRRVGPGAVSVDTVLIRPAGASARSAVGRVGEKIEVLVDHTVAVVVDAVTDFRTGSALVRRRVPLAVAVRAGLAAVAAPAAGATVCLAGREVDAGAEAVELWQGAAIHVAAGTAATIVVSRAARAGRHVVGTPGIASFEAGAPWRVGVAAAKDDCEHGGQQNDDSRCHPIALLFCLHLNSPRVLVSRRRGWPAHRVCSW